MELKIQKDTFYLLNTGSEKRLHDSENNAIQALKEIASSDKAIDPEKISIVEIDTSGHKWSITSVPWSKIAIDLIRKG